MVVVPRHHRTDDLPQLLQKKQGWILKNIARCNANPIPFDSDTLSTGDTVPYLGKYYQVRLGSNHNNECVAKLENDVFLVEGKCDDGTAAVALKRWLYGRAHTYMKQKASELAADMGISYNRIFIRSQRTRWGSCSALGNISLNWKLIMFPPCIIDYIIIHELAHLVVMGHSKVYWDVVTAHCPDWRDHRKWLRQHEGYLSISI